MLYALRDRSGPLAARAIAVPPLDRTSEGTAYTVLVAVTIVRLLVGLYRADEARMIVQAVWPLVADDPDLRASRLAVISPDRPVMPCPR